LTPLLGVTRVVKDAVDCHHILRIFVENRVRKAPDQSPSIILIDHYVHFRVATYRLNASIDASREVFTEARTPAFIPRVGLKDIPFDLWREERFSGHIDCGLDAGFPPSSAPNPDC